MTEEEKKAIEKLKSWKSYMEKDEDEIKVIDTIVNLAKKQAQEIKDLTEVNHEQGQCYYQAKIEIENLRNKVEKLQEENEELKEIKELRDKANKYDAIKKYAVKKNLKDNEIIILSKYDVNNEINETINQLIDKHQEEMRKTGDEWGYETYVIKELEKLKKYFKGELLKF